MHTTWCSAGARATITWRKTRASRIFCGRPLPDRPLCWLFRCKFHQKRFSVLRTFLFFPCRGRASNVCPNFFGTTWRWTRKSPHTASAPVPILKAPSMLPLGHTISATPATHGRLRLCALLGCRLTRRAWFSRDSSSTSFRQFWSRHVSPSTAPTDPTAEGCASSDGRLKPENSAHALRIEEYRISDEGERNT